MSKMANYFLKITQKKSWQGFVSQTPACFVSYTSILIPPCVAKKFEHSLCTSLILIKKTHNLFFEPTTVKIQKFNSITLGPLYKFVPPHPLMPSLIRPYSLSSPDHSQNITKIFPKLAKIFRKQKTFVGIFLN